MEKIDYKELYMLQDLVLESLFSSDTTLRNNRLDFYYKRL